MLLKGLSGIDTVDMHDRLDERRTFLRVIRNFLNYLSCLYTQLARKYDGIFFQEALSGT